MALYRNSREQAEDQETEELEQEMDIMAEQPVTAEEAMWKKRYADLRRHTDKLKNEATAEIEGMKSRYEQLAKGQIKLPKSEDDVIEWMGKYPEFAGILETIVSKRVNDGQRDVNRRVQELEQKQNELSVKEAYMELKSRHPDLDKLLHKESKFHDWLATKSQKYQDAIYVNIDVEDAAFVIDKYKSQEKKGKPQGEEDSSFEKEAAKVVRSGRGTQEISDDFGDYLFSESQIERESSKNSRWFDANEEKIMDAMRKGKVLLDLSGGAR